MKQSIVQDFRLKPSLVHVVVARQLTSIGKCDSESAAPGDVESGRQLLSSFTSGSAGKGTTPEIGRVINSATHAEDVPNQVQTKPKQELT